MNHEKCDEKWSLSQAVPWWSVGTSPSVTKSVTKLSQAARGRLWPSYLKRILMVLLLFLTERKCLRFWVFNNVFMTITFEGVLSQRTPYIKIQNENMPIWWTVGVSTNVAYVLEGPETCKSCFCLVRACKPPDIEISSRIKSVLHHKRILNFDFSGLHFQCLQHPVFPHRHHFDPRWFQKNALAVVGVVLVDELCSIWPLWRC